VGHVSDPDFNIAISVAESAGLSRDHELIRIGVPLPRGLLSDAQAILVRTEAGRVVPHQARVLSFWPDRTIRWLLLEALVRIDAGQRITLTLGPQARGVGDTEADWHRPISVDTSEASFTIDTGAARFVVPRQGPVLLGQVQVDGASLLSEPGARLSLTHPNGGRSELSVASAAVESSGPLSVTVLVSGTLESEARLHCQTRLTFVAGAASVRAEVLLRNPRAARHKGGLWDLGDAGSALFTDFSLTLPAPAGANRLQWQSQPGTPAQASEAPAWSLYQDSSGGVNWQSPNHVDRSGKVTTSFRGYRVEEAGGQVAEGERATPHVQASNARGWAAVACEHFWQNFPKALRSRDGTLEVGLFPRESGRLHELQGGEQKRHMVWLDFGRTQDAPTITQLQSPLTVAVAPGWIEASGAVPYFVAGEATIDPRYQRYIEGIVTGETSFFARRELIDEYGWRNFGELYADHEAVRHSGAQPFITHYNNQYDFVYGALYHFLRSGAASWYELMRDAARHLVDIDIYHTNEDRPIFNGGLFWHTDHYKPAATCTHRTYSRLNSQGRDYGGGPSNEQNYTSGLLFYYYLTGDPEAAATVRGLAEWVCAMDDGALSGFAFFDEGPTGLASKTVETGYHKAGRGAGNSINALLDAYALTGERRFMGKAEELLQRSIHPQDDVPALQLDDPERRWSYLVFLQVLGKYLQVKRELGEYDYAFWYARASLLHYARWMLEHEVPYKDVLHKVEFPTETWPAHDVRKTHILHVAASYTEGAERARLRERAGYFFDRCLTDLLSFSTSGLTRPLVILSVYGCIHGYYLKSGQPAQLPALVQHDFGAPQQFVPQRARLKASLQRKVRLLSQEMRRAAGEAAYALKTRFSR
jgi:hypothetical protein